jgi:hypothetical protein
MAPLRARKAALQRALTAARRPDALGHSCPWSLVLTIPQEQAQCPRGREQGEHERRPPRWPQGGITRRSSALGRGSGLRDRPWSVGDAGPARRTPPGGGTARVFVRHASKDAVLAAQVHHWLVADGHEAFLDQDLSESLLGTAGSSGCTSVCVGRMPRFAC